MYGNEANALYIANIILNISLRGDKKISYTALMSVGPLVLISSSLIECVMMLSLYYVALERSVPLKKSFYEYFCLSVWRNYGQGVTYEEGRFRLGLSESGCWIITQGDLEWS